MAFSVMKALERVGTTGGRVMSFEIPIPQISQRPGRRLRWTIRGEAPPLYYEFERDHGPIERGSNIRANHPITYYSGMKPKIDTPQSRPPRDIQIPPKNYSTALTTSSSVNNNVDDMATPFSKHGATAATGESGPY